MVDQGAGILRGDSSEDITAFGELLHRGWMLKRALAEGVTNSQVDKIYETAREHGAIGGKLLGAGSSGFMLLFVPPKKQPAVREALAQYLWVPFGAESEGSSIIYNSIYDVDSSGYVLAPDLVNARSE